MPVAERFLLVEDDRAVPYARLRLTSSRDYRRPPEVCVTVERDGVTLALDPARADLLVDAELAHFADPLPHPNRALRTGSVSVGRRFQISGAVAAKRNQPPHGRIATERMVRATNRRRNSSLGSSFCSQPNRHGLRASRPPGWSCSRYRAPSCSKAFDSIPQRLASSANAWARRRSPVPEHQVAPLQNALRELGITLDVE